MRFLILLSTWLAFVAVASAQDCQNGRCAQQPSRVIRTQTVYEYPKQQTPTRYTVQLEPVPVSVPVYSVPVYSLPVVTYQPATVYYRVERRGFRLFR
jgi:hypothetical protein